MAGAPGGPAAKGPSEGLPAALKKAVPWKELAIAVTAVAIASIGLIAQLHGLALPDVPIHGLGSIPLYPVFYLTGGAIIFGRLAHLGVQHYRQGKPAAQANMHAPPPAEKKAAAPPPAPPTEQEAAAAAPITPPAEKKAELPVSGKGYYIDQPIGNVEDIQCDDHLDESGTLYLAMQTERGPFMGFVLLIEQYKDLPQVRTTDESLILDDAILEMGETVRVHNIPSAAVKIRDTIYYAGRNALFYNYDSKTGERTYGYLKSPERPMEVKKKEGSKTWVVLGSRGLRNMSNPEGIVNQLREDMTPEELANLVREDAQRNGMSDVGVVVLEI